MRFLVLSIFLAATVTGCTDYGGPGDGGGTDSTNGGDPGDDGADRDEPGTEDGDGGEIYDRPGDPGGDHGGDPGGCRTHEDCATPDNPPFPEGACCGCGAYCHSSTGTCSYMCADAMCCFMGLGCGEHCEALCDQHDHCWADFRCLDGECRFEPPACGVEPDPGCHSGLEEAECRAVDGSYVCSPAGMCWCICPTGDADCLCWNPDHCDSQCTAEFQENDCSDVRIGTCTGLVQMPPGCYCVVEEDGTFTGLCID